MLDHLINEDAPTKLELATEHHWDELNRTGVTVFNSDEETRLIDLDQITLDCLNDFRLLGLHNAVIDNPIEFMFELRRKVHNMKCDLMDEALEDFYS